MSYRWVELRTEFHKLTGHRVNDILEAAGRVDDLAGVRQATHIAVAHANEVGVPVVTQGIILQYLK